MEAKISSTTTESKIRPAGVAVSSTMRLRFMNLVNQPTARERDSGLRS